MSYRLDQGQGICVYRIGVEDDGCHSLLDYENVAETAKLLETLARSLNAVVLERKMIQNEVVMTTTSSVEKDNGSKSIVRGEPKKASENTEPIIVIEPSLLGNGREQLYENVNEQEDIIVHEEKTADAPEEQHQKNHLQKEGTFTRCELTIQRIETHLLDPTPISKDGVSAKTSTSGEEKDEDRHQPHHVGETLSTRNIRIAMVGNVDAGKSTLTGALTSGMLDDGRGSARTSIMKHRHEIESGRTSTAQSHLMGFKASGEAINSHKDHVRASRRKSDDELAKEAHRVITLMDLAGHEKYLKTT